MLPNRYVAFLDSSNDVAGVGNGTSLTSAPGDKWDSLDRPVTSRPSAFPAVSSRRSHATASSTAYGSGARYTVSGTEVVSLNGSNYTVPLLGPGGSCTADALLLPNGPSDVSSSPAVINTYNVPQNTDV